MQDSINKIISNALLVNKDNLTENIQNLISQIYEAFKNNKDAIVKANEIDRKNNNGFLIDFSIIDNIFSNLKKETMIYGSVTLSQKDDNNNVVYGIQVMDCGNVVVINDGNPYVIIEMIIRNIIAGNTTIFS